ncbi:MAG: hypothetical protein HN684_04225 [Euryarchaeota archaeon]|jgi:hypothetical protein|nr:hypothetical protein [Euryarchaeota archaeon]
MNNCHGCNEKTNEEWCEYCQVFAPLILNYSIESLGTSKEFEKLHARMGNPKPEIKRVWRAFADMKKDRIEWLYRKPASEYEYKWIIEAPPPWKISQEHIYQIEAEHGVRDPNIRKLLHRGGILPDESYLSYADQSFFIDGTKINLPYRDLSKMVLAYGVEEIDWKTLLFSLHIATANYRASSNDRDRFIPTNMMTHPMYVVKNRSSRNQQYWARQFGRRSPRKDSIRMFFKENLQLFETTPWSNTWFNNENNQNNNGNVPINLIIRNGRLMTRVRRGEKWRLIRVPNNPEIWAQLINWSLSAPGHPERINIDCFQQQLFADTDSHLLKKEDIRGINFLRGIIENSDRISLILATSGEKMDHSIRVEGTSGEFYKIKPGLGPHNTRFKVTAGGAERDHRRRELCIVERPELRKLVLGDALGSIAMALLDDENSSKHIGTLRAHLSNIGRGGNRQEYHRVRMEIDNLQHRIVELNGIFRDVHQRRGEQDDDVVNAQLEELENQLQRLQHIRLMEENRR